MPNVNIYMHKERVKTNNIITARFLAEHHHHYFTNACMTTCHHHHHHHHHPHHHHHNLVRSHPMRISWHHTRLQAKFVFWSTTILKKWVPSSFFPLIVLKWVDTTLDTRTHAHLVYGFSEFGMIGIIFYRHCIPSWWHSLIHSYSQPHTHIHTANIIGDTFPTELMLLDLWLHDNNPSNNWSSTE